MLDRLASLRIHDIDIVPEGRHLHFPRVRWTRRVGTYPRCPEIRSAAHAAEMDVRGEDVVEPVVLAGFQMGTPGRDHAQWREIELPSWDAFGSLEFFEIAGGSAE